MIKYFSLFLIIILLSSTALSQEISEDSTNDSTSIFDKKVLSLAAVSGFYIGTMFDSYVTWWKDDKRPFTFMNDPWFNNYGDNGIDKLGHFYTSYLFYKTQKNILLWGGYTPKTSKIISGSLTFMMGLLIEVGDGFSRYGFDVKDFISNTAGLSYAVLQDEVPFFQNFNVKWSYFPSKGIVFPPRFSDHYEGHIYWMTFNVHGIWDEFGESPWPEYIQPAIGYSISKDIESEYTFGIDINLLPLFRSETPALQYLGDFINLFHIPSPGVKYVDGKKPEYKLFLVN